MTVRLFEHEPTEEVETVSDDMSIRVRLEPGAVHPGPVGEELTAREDLGVRLAHAWFTLPELLGLAKHLRYQRDSLVHDLAEAGRLQGDPGEAMERLDRTILDGLNAGSDGPFPETAAPPPRGPSSRNPSNRNALRESS